MVFPWEWPMVLLGNSSGLPREPPAVLSATNLSGCDTVSLHDTDTSVPRLIHVSEFLIRLLGRQLGRLLGSQLGRLLGSQLGCLLGSQLGRLNA